MSPMQFMGLGAAIVISIGLFLVLAHLVMPYVRAGLQQMFVILRDVCNMVAGQLARAVGGLRNAMTGLRNHIDQGHGPGLAGKIIAVLFLVPAVLLSLAGEIRFTMPFWEAFSPEVLVVLSIEMSGGLQRAIGMALGGVLLGYMIEALATGGRLAPIPFLGGIDEQATRAKARRLLLVACAILWLFVGGLQADIAQRSFNIFADGTCRIQQADAGLPDVASTDGTDIALAVDPAAHEAAVQQCIADFKSNGSDQVFVAVTLVGYVLAFLFAFALYTAVALLAIVGLALLMVAPGFLMGVFRLLAFVIEALWFVVNQVLHLLEWLGGQLARLLGIHRDNDGPGAGGNAATAPGEGAAAHNAAGNVQNGLLTAPPNNNPQAAPPPAPATPRPETPAAPAAEPPNGGTAGPASNGTAAQPQNGAVRRPNSPEPDDFGLYAVPPRRPGASPRS